MYWFFIRLVSAEILADLFWWWRADRRLRKLKPARWYRPAAAGWFAFQAGSFIWVLLARFRGVQVHFWALPLAAVYLWHLLILPTWLLCMLISGLGHLISAAIRRIRRPHPSRKITGTGTVIFQV